MQVINSIILALLFAVHTVVSLPSVLSPGNDLPEQYQLSNITWTGSLIKNGPNISFTGRSLEDIDTQIKATFPGHVWPSTPKPKANASTGINKSTQRVVCDMVRYSEADYEAIIAGVKYLSGKTGYCEMSGTEPGAPLSCGRVSCSYNSGIFFCNQNNYPTSQPCNWFADYAQSVLDTCLDEDTYPNIKGQDYDSDGWSVIVGGQEC
ncbi:hypothetical protein F5X99DRAFT_426151 [Biscogniauxia marginata]|nr:hypothetical protein F5X99DRAFT_426151 [Biscogniauxia marginata]